LHVASYLLAREYKLIRIDGDRRKYFIFENVPTHEVTDFYNGTVLVNARKLLSSLRDLKGQISI
jgi:hypothetical protein